MYQLAVQVMAHLGDFTLFNSFQHGTTGFGQMMAVVEPAFAQIGAEFTESPFQSAFGQMVETEFLEAWGVDDSSGSVNAVKVGVGGGVPPRIQGG